MGEQLGRKPWLPIARRARYDPRRDAHPRPAEPPQHRPSRHQRALRQGALGRLGLRERRRLDGAGRARRSARRARLGARTGRRRRSRRSPSTAKSHATRRAVGRMLNILQVGESVAQNVCAKLVLVLREEDYRNHAAAQAMDEARHHLAYRRFLDRMDEEVEDIDAGTEMMFDALLATNDPLELIATEQFFLESFAMSIFESAPRARDASAAAPDHRADHARREPAHGLRRALHRRVDAPAAARAADRVRAPVAGPDPRLAPRPARSDLPRARRPAAPRRRGRRRRALGAADAARAAGDQRRRARRGRRRARRCRTS